MDWTIRGTTEDGAPFTVKNRGMFYSDWNATSTLYKLLSAIDALQFNEFTKVTFTSIKSEGMITKHQREGEIVNVRTSSSLEPSTSRPCSLGLVRPFTKLMIAVLFLMLAVAAVAQLFIAHRDRPPYPGPVPGTPLPTVTASP